MTPHNAPFPDNRMELKSNIVKRLRARCPGPKMCNNPELRFDYCPFCEAAARIEEQSKEIADMIHDVDRAVMTSGQLAAENAELRARIEKLEEALTPSAETKAAYIGEFRMTIRRVDEYGDDQSLDVPVSWTAIKEIMKAIRARALLDSKRREDYLNEAAPFDGESSGS